MIDPKKGDAYQGHKKTNPARKARLHPGRSSPAKQLGIPQKLRIPKNFLVGGLEPWNFMTFHSVGNVIPTDELIFFRGVGQPPTSFRYCPSYFGMQIKIDDYFLGMD